jgi:hypothetical protein
MMVTSVAWSASGPPTRHVDERGKKHTNIFVCQLVRETDSLRLVLDRLAVHDGRLELLSDAPMNGIALGQVSIKG